MTTEISAEQKSALERLIAIAQSDTGQSRRVANFLLAWWNASECGGFDMTDLWQVDEAIASDMVAVFRLLANCHSYPDTLGYELQFARIIDAWRTQIKRA
jgi:hypothetical protein